MTSQWEHVRAAFRLDLEQQQKQARGLLKAAQAADAAALARISAQVSDAAEKLRSGSFKLADAQSVIARELRFATWNALKAHIQALNQARDAIRNKQDAPDADMRTLHVRCGSDIQQSLLDAGFCGDFFEVSYPYCYGPVTAGPNRHEIEARFIVETAGKLKGITYEEVLASRHDEDRRLLVSASDYERVVLWKEHDCYDQLVLVRCLAHYACSPRPRVLELIDIDYFPGRRADGMPVRFLGLGQLPEEALRLLWARRQPVTQEQLALATDLKLMAIVEYMQALSEPVLTRTSGDTPWQDIVTITELGRAVLRGKRDFLALGPPVRWVGGVQVDPKRRSWRWNDVAQQAVLLEA